MDKKVCKNCKYFYQHYTKISWGYLLTNCGHCPRYSPKHRRPGMRACPLYEEAENAEEYQK